MGENEKKIFVTGGAFGQKSVGGNERDSLSFFRFWRFFWV